MEFGPRALGNRSILADPRNKENWHKINRLVKFREDFRPLAPAILEERSMKFFDFDRPSPFMLFTAKNLTEKLPAVTHVDQSSRIQTVSKTSVLLHGLISEFEELTGTPVLINTSLNVAAMPIACTPQNAYQCFMQAGLDVLIVNSFLITKEKKVER